MGKDEETFRDLPVSSYGKKIQKIRDNRKSIVASRARGVTISELAKSLDCSTTLLSTEIARWERSKVK